MKKHGKARTGVYFTFVLFVLLSSVFTSCTKQSESPPSQQIIGAFFNAQEQISTFRSNVSVKADLQVPGLKNSGLVMSMQVKSAVSIPAREMEMEAATSVTISGQNTKINIATIIDGDFVYYRQASNGIQEDWTVKALSPTEKQKVWDEQSSLISTGRYLDILVTADFEPVKEEKRRGFPCYKLKVVTDDALMNTLLTDQLLPGADTLGLFSGQVSDSIRKIEIIYWINRDTYTLVEYRISAEIETQVEGKNMAGKIENTAIFSDYGVEISIEKPPEVLSTE